MSNLLNELATKYKADKWGKHHYTPVYYEMFKDRRETVKKVVEIGTGEGASIMMWAEFFPNATIYGVDIDIARVTTPPVREGIVLLQADQASELDLTTMLEETGTDIDLFVDDGSHLPIDQTFTFREVMPKLDKNATYVIEDVAEPSITMFPPFDKDKYEIRNIKVGGRYDDRLIIARYK